jgi:uncharacterized membrane protein YdfJ with MMPL/SSD domain
MLEAMAALILAIVGAILIMMILAYGIYVTFYPLSKTVQSGMAVAQVQVEEVAEQRLLGEKIPEPTMAKYA